MAIVNSVRNILEGFGVSARRGGVLTVSGAPPLNAVIQFPAGQSGINCGYVKVRISTIAGGTNPMLTGLAIYASDTIALQNQIVMASFPAGVTPPNGWLSDMVFPFVGDNQYIWFSCNGYFSAGTTNASMDFEVWGNALAGGN